MRRSGSLVSLLFLGFCFSAASSIAQEVNFVELSKKLVPSVVNISTSSTAKVPTQRGGRQDDLFRKFFEDFFNREPPGEGEEEDAPPPDFPPGARPGMKRPLALGTGFIIDESGLILTNHHVVLGADEILVHFTEDANEEPASGEVVGRDPELDLALIKVKTKKKLIPAILGDSDRLEVGEYVIAIGNPFGQGHTVTHGIISAKDRKSPDFAFARYLQTDAPINPGNSGGPLVKTTGEVIGINNAIDARAQGIGFAIPINIVKKVLPELKSKGSVTRGYIGILVNDLTPEVAEQIKAPKKTRGPFVAHVYPDQPAAKAGVKAYDVILEADGKKVMNASDLIEIITQVSVGSSVSLKVLRAGKEMSFNVKAVSRPNETPGFQKRPPRKPNLKKKPAIDSGLDLGELTPDIRKELGVPKNLKGVLVESVKYESVADRAGLLRGDLILEVNRKPVLHPEDFYRIVNAKKSYLLRVRRTKPSGEDHFSVIVLDLK